LNEEYQLILTQWMLNFLENTSFHYFSEVHVACFQFSMFYAGLCLIFFEKIWVQKVWLIFLMLEKVQKVWLSFFRPEKNIFLWKSWFSHSIKIIKSNFPHFFQHKKLQSSNFRTFSDLKNDKSPNFRIFFRH
jgi:hypothetical protein